MRLQRQVQAVHPRGVDAAGEGLAVGGEDIDDRVVNEDPQPEGLSVAREQVNRVNAAPAPGGAVQVAQQAQGDARPGEGVPAGRRDGPQVQLRGGGRDDQGVGVIYAGAGFGAQQDRDGYGSAFHAAEGQAAGPVTLQR